LGKLRKAFPGNFGTLKVGMGLGKGGDIRGLAQNRAFWGLKKFLPGKSGYKSSKQETKGRISEKGKKGLYTGVKNGI